MPAARSWRSISSRSLTGRDADLLRIDGLWQGKHYAAAAS